MTTFGDTSVTCQHTSDLFSSDSDDDDFDASFDTRSSKPSSGDRGSTANQCEKKALPNESRNSEQLDSSFVSRSSKKQAPPPPNPFGEDLVSMNQIVILYCVYLTNNLGFLFCFQVTSKF